MSTHGVRGGEEHRLVEVQVHHHDGLWLAERTRERLGDRLHGGRERHGGARDVAGDLHERHLALRGVCGNDDCVT